MSNYQQPPLEDIVLNVHIHAVNVRDGKYCVGRDFLSIEAPCAGLEIYDPLSESPSVSSHALYAFCVDKIASKNKGGECEGIAGLCDYNTCSAFFYRDASPSKAAVLCQDLSMLLLTPTKYPQRRGQEALYGSPYTVHVAFPKFPPTLKNPQRASMQNHAKAHLTLHPEMVQDVLAPNPLLLTLIDSVPKMDPFIAWNDFHASVIARFGKTSQPAKDSIYLQGRKRKADAMTRVGIDEINDEMGLRAETLLQKRRKLIDSLKQLYTHSLVEVEASLQFYRSEGCFRSVSDISQFATFSADCFLQRIPGKPRLDGNPFIYDDVNAEWKLKELWAHSFPTIDIFEDRCGWNPARLKCLFSSKPRAGVDYAPPPLPHEHVPTAATLFDATSSNATLGDTETGWAEEQERYVCGGHDPTNLIGFCISDVLSNRNNPSTLLLINPPYWQLQKDTTSMSAGDVVLFDRFSKSNADMVLVYEIDEYGKPKSSIPKTHNISLYYVELQNEDSSVMKQTPPEDCARV